jgi:hypothetical protein
MTKLTEPTAVSDPLARLPNKWRTYVVVPQKILYISVPKNACTSLKWLIAELAGEDLDRFRPGLAPLLNTEDAIHRRGLFQRTPKLGQLDPDLRRTITPDNGWFVFAVVRDPRDRLFSAWENKFLMRTPDYRRWREESWYPKRAETAEDVVGEFATFVKMLATHRDHPLHRDDHFSNQTRLIRPDVVPYSRIYDVTEIKTLLADLGSHLRAQGVDTELHLRRSNDTPLRANKQVFGEPVRSQIESLYAVDFDNFGRFWDYGRIERVPGWTPAAMADLEARRALHDRIDDLLRSARQEKQRAIRAERRLERIEQEVERSKAAARDPRPGPARTTARKARSAGRRVKARLRRLLARETRVRRR